MTQTCVNSDQRRQYHKQWREANPEKYAKAHRTAAKKWQKKNPDRRRNYQLKSRFGISLDDYNTLLVQQGNSCAICKVEKCSTGRSFSVDHCHETDIVRGLLCKNCNLLIGLGKNSVEVLTSAAAYLDKFNEESYTNGEGGVCEWKPPVQI